MGRARAFLATPRGRAFGRRMPRGPFAFSLRNATASFANARLRWPNLGCSAALSIRFCGRNDDFRPLRTDRRPIALQAAGAYAHVGFSDGG